MSKPQTSKFLTLKPAPMNNQQIMQYAPYIAIGVFVLLALIIVPIVLRSTRKKRNNAENFFPELAQKTGLKVNHDRLDGNYKGFFIEYQYKLGTNVINAYKTLTGNSNVHGRHAVFPQLHVTVTLDQPVGGVALFEKVSMMHYSQKLQDAVTGKGTEYPKLKLDGSQLKNGLEVYGTDEAAALRLLNSSELKVLLGTWQYTDIKTEGNKVKLTMDNNNATVTVGFDKIYSHPFAIQAMDIAVAAAKAVKG